MTFHLSNETPFAAGGNRVCYVHPDDPALCIKVRRPDFSLADKRNRASFPKRLLPLSSFDDNAEEFRVMQQLDENFGESLYAHVSRCHGFVDTDLGAGLVSELVRDENDEVSETLKKYLWDYGFTEDCQKKLTEFAEHWQKTLIPSRALLLHNIVVQRDNSGCIQRLVVIDGLGSPNLIPFWLYPLPARQNKIKRRIDDLYARIEHFKRHKKEDGFPGYHGLLLKDKHTEKRAIPDQTSKDPS